MSAQQISQPETLPLKNDREALSGEGSSSNQASVVVENSEQKVEKDKQVQKKTRVQLIWNGDGWAPPQMQYFIRYKRDWQTIREFYKAVVLGKLNFSESLGLDLDKVRRDILIGPNNEHEHLDKKKKGIDKAGGAVLTGKQPVSLTTPKNVGQRRRHTYRILVRFYGPRFEGSSFTKDHYTVEQAIQQRLQKLAPGEKIIINGAGRTDRGVSAACYALSFYCWQELSQDVIINAINEVDPDNLRAYSIEEMPKSFHGSYSAEWRRYVYLFPLKGGGKKWTAEDAAKVAELAIDYDRKCVEQWEVDIPKIDQMLRRLEGQEIDYNAYARDTPNGKDTKCILKRARAYMVTLPPIPSSEQQEDYIEQTDAPLQALCMDIVGNRFLRRMVRVLAATVIRESVPIGASLNSEDETLILISQKRDRLGTAPGLLADGLCFAGVGYKDKGLLQ